jgi:hypothetical protein
LTCGTIAEWSGKVEVVDAGYAKGRRFRRATKRRSGSVSQRERLARWGGPCSENGSGEKTERDEAEVEALGTAFFAGFGCAGGVECVVDAFDCVAQIAGDEGGVEGEPVDAAETGDLEGGDVGDDRGEGDVGEAEGHPAQGKERENFEGNGDDRGAVAARAQIPDEMTPAKKPRMWTRWGMTSLHR